LLVMAGAFFYVLSVLTLPTTDNPSDGLILDGR